MANMVCDSSWKRHSVMRQGEHALLATLYETGGGLGRVWTAGGPPGRSNPKEARIYGEATIDGSGSHLFLVEVKDLGKSGKQDTYRILLSNGYDSGEHTLLGGNITITQK